jgi:hypothetical protein
MEGDLGGACGTHRQRRNALGTLMRKPDEYNHLKDIDVDVSAKLKWFLKKLAWKDVCCS